MRRVLLVVPKVVCTNSLVSPGQGSRDSVPLGAAYVAGAARAGGHRVRVLDTRVTARPGEALRRALRALRPDLVGIAAYTFTADDSLRLAREVRALAPRTFILLGGPHATVYPRECMEEPAVDAVAAGEAESSIVELLEALPEREKVSRVAGLWVRSSRGVRLTRHRPPPADLDALPRPAWDLLPLRRYALEQFVLGRRVAPLMSARGCPFPCSYCASHLIFGRKVRRHGIDRVLAEMNELHARWGIDGFEFQDDTFTLDRERTLALCAAIKAEGRADFAWMCYTRADRVDPELLASMRAAGCRYLYLGVESGSQRLLDKVGKGLTVEQNARAISWCRQAGITVGVGIMVGLPTETPEETAQTIRFVVDQKLDQACFNITEPFPGTVMWTRDRDEGGYVEGARGENGWNSGRVWVPKGRTLSELRRWIELGCRAAGVTPKLVG